MARRAMQGSALLGVAPLAPVGASVADAPLFKIACGHFVSRLAISLKNFASPKVGGLGCKE